MDDSGFHSSGVFFLLADMIPICLCQVKLHDLGPSDLSLKTAVFVGSMKKGITRMKDWKASRRTWQHADQETVSNLKKAIYKKRPALLPQ